MAGRHRYIYLEPTAAQKDAAALQVAQIHAAQEAKTGQPYLNGSFLKGGGDLPGKVAEIVVGEFYAPYFRPTTGSAIYGQDYYGAPYRPDENDRASTFDIKSVTMSKDYVPGPDHNAHVSEKSAQHQHPDFFIFARTHVDLKYVYVVGFLSYDAFFQRCVKNTRNKIDPQGHDQWAFPEPCYSVAIAYLWDPPQPDELNILLEKEKYFKTRQPVCS